MQYAALVWRYYWIIACDHQNLLGTSDLGKSSFHTAHNGYNKTQYNGLTWMELVTCVCSLTWRQTGGPLCNVFTLCKLRRAGVSGSIIAAKLIRMGGETERGRVSAKNACELNRYCCYLWEVKPLSWVFIVTSNGLMFDGRNTNRHRYSNGRQRFYLTGWEQLNEKKINTLLHEMVLSYILHRMPASRAH